MKNVLIAGVSRSGKSLLAHRLSERLHYSHFPLDAIVSTFGKVFPEHGISHYEKDQVKMCNSFKPFLFELLRHLEYEDINFIADTYHIKPADFLDFPSLKKYKVVFLGYPSVFAQDKCIGIRSYARAGDWTNELSDKQLESLVQRYVEESKLLQESCEKTDFRFADTSEDFTDILDKICDEMVQSLEDSVPILRRYAASEGD
ncbi:MAG: hypothetical protein V2A78_12370 [bacterium]